MYVNARSLGKKLDLLEAESENFDIITLSETWLSKKDDDNDLRLTNFHSPVRQARADDPHGGVTTFVRNNLYCKSRPDLHVNNLEAIWVETKLNQENLLVGSFYRPPNAKTEYCRKINSVVFFKARIGKTFLKQEASTKVHVCLQKYLWILHKSACQLKQSVCVQMMPLG